MKTDFEEFARNVAARHQLEGILPVVEKELIHYDILQALDASGWLDRLTFQGGTCLRLCYGSARYSEDLDFNVREELARVDLAGFARVLSGALGAKYEVGVRVKKPVAVKAFEGGGLLKRWQVVVDTAPERPGLPSQKIKIEIAQLPAYTREARLLTVNYPEVSGSLGGVLISCQSMGEILADKIISFANARQTVRYRDLWDIPWIMGQGVCDMEGVARMVCKKHGDYGCDLPLRELLSSGGERAEHLVQSDAFTGQMRRFIPRSAYDLTLGRPGYIEALGARLRDAYGTVAGLALTAEL